MLASCNVPPYVVEILMGRNEPMEAQGQQMFRRDAVFDWMVPAHRVFRNIGRDVSVTSARRLC
jgi:hypothetical protein